jgi:hypothetical protein
MYIGVLADMGLGADPYTRQLRNISGYPETENWAKALGDHKVWGSATVTRKGDQMTMKVTVHALDQYDFNDGAKDIRSGVPDNVNGRFATLGWAKPFLVRGTFTRNVTWTVGQAGSTTEGNDVYR